MTTFDKAPVGAPSLIALLGCAFDDLLVVILRCFGASSVVVAHMEVTADNLLLLLLAGTKPSDPNQRDTRKHNLLY